MKRQLQLFLWFLILIHFSPNTSLRDRLLLYKKSGVSPYKSCSADLELVQVDNDAVWKALETLKNDKHVMDAGVSIEGACQ
jgi:hypothetical protein